MINGMSAKVIACAIIAQRPEAEAQTDNLAWHSKLAYGFSDATFDRNTPLYDPSITMSPLRFVCVLMLILSQASKKYVTIALHKREALRQRTYRADNALHETLYEH